MFYIEEKPRAYILKTNRYLGEEFSEYTKELKDIYIFYSKEDSGWKIPKSQISSVLLYIEKKLKWTIDDKPNIKVSLPMETKFIRKAEFDESLLKVKLFQYQFEDVLWGLQRNRIFIASDPGVGKTIETIAIISQYFKDNKIDGCFISVKNALSYHWKKEILDYSVLFNEEDILIVDNNIKHDIFEMNLPKIIICPNHLTDSIVSKYKTLDIKKKWNKKSLALVLDESHEFKNEQAKRTKAILKIKKDFEYRILLSATPAINNFEDWHTQLQILDESIIPLNKKSFCLDIAKSIGNKFGAYNINSYEPEKVKEYIGSFKPWVIKRLKSELKEMKVKQFIKPIFVQLIPKHFQLYNLIRDAYLLKYDIDKNDRFSTKQIQNKFPYLLMCLEDPMLLKDRIVEQNEDSKIFDSISGILKSWTYDFHSKILNLDQRIQDICKVHKQKLIVFDNHPSTLNNLAKRYYEFNPLIIHGEIEEKGLERQKIVDEFNDRSSKHKVIFLNPQTGGTGLNLNKACKNTIYLSSPTDSTLWRQSLDRTHRISSVEDSIVNVLTFAKTIDEQIVETNFRRLEFNDNTFKDNLDLERLII